MRVGFRKKKRKCEGKIKRNEPEKVLRKESAKESARKK